MAFSAEALYDAAYNKCDGDMVSRILDNNSKLLNQPIEQDFGGGVLHCVAEKGLIDIARQLLEREDIDVNIGNKNGCTPLYYSCSFDNLDVAKLLLEHKADIELARKVTEKNMITPTANEIDYVVFFPSFTQLCLECQSGATPLYVASQNGHPALVKLLLQYKASPDVATNVMRVQRTTIIDNMPCA